MFGRYVENAFIREDKQGSLEVEDYPACKELFQKRYRRASRCNAEDCFALTQKRPDKGHFVQHPSLAFFDSSFVDVLVICKQDIGIHGKVKQVLST